MYFREKVVQLRKDASMTQEYFAKAVGVSRQAVYKWEKGKSYPEAEKLILIAKLFGVTIDSLLEKDYDLYKLTLPAVKGEEKAKKPARKKEPVAIPVVKEELKAEKVEAAAVAEPVVPTVTEEKIVVKEPAPVKAAVHKAQPKKQPQKQNIFGEIRGRLFGRKK